MRRSRTVEVGSWVEEDKAAHRAGRTDRGLVGGDADDVDRVAGDVDRRPVVEQPDPELDLVAAAAVGGGGVERALEVGRVGAAAFGRGVDAEGRRPRQGRADGRKEDERGQRQQRRAAGDSSELQEAHR
jgi:hypothetical protein